MRLEQTPDERLQPLEPANIFGLESDAVPELICEGHNGAWRLVIGWGIVGVISLLLLPTFPWLLGVVPFGLILPLFNLALALSEGRVQRAFLPNEVRSITKWGSKSSSYETWCRMSLGSIGPDKGFSWKVKAVKGISPSPADLDELPAEDMMMRVLAVNGVVTNSPWGTMKASEPVSAGSAAWRQRGDSKWILALPGLFLLGVAVYILREPALDDALAWVMGGIGVLWLAVWLSLAASRPGAKGALEFNDQGLRVTARGQVLSEIDFADLRRFEIQTRTGSLGRREKRIVALTHYAREVPMTDWLTTWDSTGEFVISQALKRGLSIGFEGLKHQEALPDE